MGGKDTVAAGRPFTTTDSGGSERQQRTKVRYKEKILAMDKTVCVTFYRHGEWSVLGCCKLITFSSPVIPRLIYFHSK